MTEITRLTFTDGFDKVEELDFSGEGVLHIKDLAKIRVDPAVFPNNDVRGWIVVASNEEGLQYSGEVIGVSEEVSITGVMITFECLPADKKTKPGPKQIP